MKKISYSELRAAFVEHNRKNGITTKCDKNPLRGVIVFDPVASNWKPQFLDCSLECRSYALDSCNKAFIDGQLGYSIFASALDGSDIGVRLEAYMAEERGGENGWVVDYCYLLEG